MTTASHYDLAHHLFEFLVAGDETACRDLVFDNQEYVYPNVQSVCETLADAFHKIGDAWECSDIDTYTEHVATQIGHRILFDVRSELRATNDNAPRAIGCTPEQDPYSLPTLMVELVLKDLGWDASSLGTNLPLELLEPALDRIKPDLCWVSVSYVDSLPRLEQQLHNLGLLARDRGVKVVCGGQAIDAQMLQGIPYLDYVPELSMLKHV